MANVKDIYLEADVPFDCFTGKTHHDPGRGMTNEHAAIFAAWILNPVSGLTHQWRSLGYVDNDKGGKTAMYKLTISGSEALRYETVMVMRDALEDAGGIIRRVSVYDLEAHELINAE